MVYKAAFKWSRRSSLIAIHPWLLADQTGNPRLFVGDRVDPALRCEAGNFENKLGPDRFPEFFRILNRRHEGTRPSDHAVFVIEIEVVDIHRRIGRLFHHDWQSIDGDALLQRRVSRAGDGGSLVVRPITGNIDDAPQPAIGILFYSDSAKLIAPEIEVREPWRTGV